MLKFYILIQMFMLVYCTVSDFFVDLPWQDCPKTDRILVGMNEETESELLRLHDNDYNIEFKYDEDSNGTNAIMSIDAFGWNISFSFWTSDSGRRWNYIYEGDSSVQVMCRRTPPPCDVHNAETIVYAYNDYFHHIQYAFKRLDEMYNDSRNVYYDKKRGIYLYFSNNGWHVGPLINTSAIHRKDIYVDYAFHPQFITHPVPGIQKIRCVTPRMIPVTPNCDFQRLGDVDLCGYKSSVDPDSGLEDFSLQWIEGMDPILKVNVPENELLRRQVVLTSPPFQIDNSSCFYIDCISDDSKDNGSTKGSLFIDFEHLENNKNLSSLRIIIGSNSNGPLNTSVNGSTAVSIHIKSVTLVQGIDCPSLHTEMASIKSQGVYCFNQSSEFCNGNGRLCISSGKSFNQFCNCFEQFTGLQCQFQIDPEKCPDDLVIPNGYVTYKSHGNSNGSFAFNSCSPGYKKNGQVTPFQCINRTWVSKLALLCVPLSNANLLVKKGKYGPSLAAKLTIQWHSYMYGSRTFHHILHVSSRSNNYQKLLELERTANLSSNSRLWAKFYGHEMCIGFERNKPPISHVVFTSDCIDKNRFMFIDTKYIRINQWRKVLDYSRKVINQTKQKDYLLISFEILNFPNRNSSATFHTFPNFYFIPSTIILIYPFMYT